MNTIQFGLVVVEETTLKDSAKHTTNMNKAFFFKILFNSDQFLMKRRFKEST